MGRAMGRAPSIPDEPQDHVAVALARTAHDWSTSRSLPPRPRQSDRLFPNFAEWWQTPLLFT
jgi:hypothetical protein